MLPLTVSIDHRDVDGWHIAGLHRAIVGDLQAPEAHEPPLDSTAVGVASDAPAATGPRRAHGRTEGSPR